MTLDKAIKHAEEVAKEKYNEAQESIMCNRFQYADNCRDCAEEHEQLAEWLKDYKRLLDEERPQDEWVRKEDVIHSIAKQYSEHNELVPIWLSIGDMKGDEE